MPDVDPNPYSPPVESSGATAFTTRWCVIPAAGSFLLGLVSFAFGMFAVAVMTFVVMTQNANETVGGMIAGCVLYLGFGAAWMMAGWLHWCRRYRNALIANGVGILIPVVLFAILGV